MGGCLRGELTGDVDEQAGDDFIFQFFVKAGADGICDAGDGGSIDRVARIGRGSLVGFFQAKDLLAGRWSGCLLETSEAAACSNMRPPRVTRMVRHRDHLGRFCLPGWSDVAWFAYSASTVPDAVLFTRLSPDCLAERTT